MKREPVESSNLKSVGYNADDEILELEFHSGGIYQYFEFPSEEYEALMQASSKGRHFLNYIDDSYEYRRVN